MDSNELCRGVSLQNLYIAVWVFLGITFLAIYNQAYGIALFLASINIGFALWLYLCIGTSKDSSSQAKNVSSLGNMIQLLLNIISIIISLIQLLR